MASQNSLQHGKWLGIDVGSARKKVCSFCLIELDDHGNPVVSFEQGPAGEPYPQTNTKDTFLDLSRSPTYLNAAVEQAVGAMLDGSELVGRLLHRTEDSIRVVAIDAPVALAIKDEPSRLTEQASTQTFSTPNGKAFETELKEKADPFLRVNSFWKCIGFAIYRHFATGFASQAIDCDQQTIAAWTCPGETTTWRIRETFPSDVYKRANGLEGVLDSVPRELLRRLVAPQVTWQAVGSKGCKPLPSTLRRLTALRDALYSNLEAEDERHDMRKYSGTYGDLWDAFTCAFTACNEDHQGGKFHGWSDDHERQRRLQQEGTILTVRSQLTNKET